MILMFSQITKALTFLHYCKKTVHWDIKPENIVICPSKTVKLIDFGVAWWLSRNDEVVWDTNVAGTYSHMAPELVTKKARSTKPIDLIAADMWSLGITIYQALLYELPVVKTMPEV